MILLDAASPANRWISTRSDAPAALPDMIRQRRVHRSRQFLRLRRGAIAR